MFAKYDGNQKLLHYFHQENWTNCVGGDNGHLNGFHLLT